MDQISFSIDGKPVPKGRVRATVRGGFARLYTPDTTRKFESAAKAIARAAMRGHPPFKGPLSLSLRIRLEVPKSFSKRARAAALAGEEAYLGRADCSNYAKSVEDSMNGVCWIDDVQIVRLFVTKVASETPGIDVKIQCLEPQT